MTLHHTSKHHKNEIINIIVRFFNLSSFKQRKLQMSSRSSNRPSTKSTHVRSTPNKFKLWLQKVTDNPIKYLIILVLFVLAISFLKTYILQFWTSITSFFGGLGSTLTQSQADYKAQKLYEAMHGAGTNESAIIELLSGTSLADFNKVKQAFGRRNYSGTGGVIFGGSELDLVGWLKEELTLDDIVSMNNHIPYLSEVLG